MKMILLSLFFSATLLSAEATLKLATTTSTYETGILDYLLAPFEKRTNVKVRIISAGSGKAIELARNGDVDVILVHAREAEDKFVSEGYGVNRMDVMYNDFIILGPGHDPAGIAKTKNVFDAFKKIAQANSPFVSRGDESGTDKKEKQIWRTLKIKPAEKCYLESGQGMNATLRIADEKNAYVLSDRSSYAFIKDELRLKILAEGDTVLVNPYGVIAVNPKKHPHVKYAHAIALIEWFVSPECQKMIDEYTVKGQHLFHAGAVK